MHLLYAVSADVCMCGKSDVVCTCVQAGVGYPEIKSTEPRSEFYNRTQRTEHTRLSRSQLNRAADLPSNLAPRTCAVPQPDADPATYTHNCSHNRTSTIQCIQLRISAYRVVHDNRHHVIATQPTTTSRGSSLPAHEPVCAPV